MGRKEQPSGNSVWSLPKTIIHFHVATASTACSLLVSTTLKGKALKRNMGGKLFACKTEAVKFPLDESMYLSFSPMLFYLPHRNIAQTPALTQTSRVTLTESMIWTR